MNSLKTRAAIMHRLIELGSPFEFRPASDVVWTAPECFHGLNDLESAATELLEEFGSELSACQILEPQEDGPPRIKPEFAQSASPMIAMIPLDIPDSFRLLTQESATMTQPPPVVNALRDLTTLRRLKQRRGLLLLTQTVCEAAVLRTLGLPATPAGPLQCLNGKQLKNLAVHLLRARRLFKDDQGVEFTPVLAGWHPGGSSAQQQPWVDDLARFLAQAARSLNVEFGDIAVWHPSEAERDEFEFVIRSGDAESFWSVVSSSIESSSYAVEGFDASEIERMESPSDWREALQRVRTLIDQETQHGEENPQLAEWVEVYSDLVDRDLVEPIHVQSSKTNDPIQIALLAHAAETTRTLQMQLPGIHRHLASLAAGRDRGANEDLLKQLSQRHRSVRDLLQLVRAIRK